MLHTDMQTHDSRGLSAESYFDPRLQSRSGRELRTQWSEIDSALETLNQHSAVRHRRSLELMHLTPRTLTGSDACALAPQFELSPLYPQRLDPSTILRFRKTFWSQLLGDTQPHCERSTQNRTPVIAITWQPSERGFGSIKRSAERFDIQTGELNQRPRARGYSAESLVESGDIWSLHHLERQEAISELKRFIRHYRGFLDRLVHIDAG